MTLKPEQRTRAQFVTCPPLDISVAISGIITVTTAGTAVQGPDTYSENGFMAKAHPDNTDTVWVGNNGSSDVSSTGGYPLNTGESVPVGVTNLNEAWFDADVNGEKICWLKI
jgi:hypothetical protein